MCPIPRHDGIKGRRRVLLLAYACSPYRGSEAGVGWQRAIETAKYFDTWVIVRKREFEEEIKQFFKIRGVIPGLHFIFVPEKRIQEWIWKLPKIFYGIIVYIEYNFWHRRAYRLAVTLQKHLQFDIVHHVTWCAFREPGYFWKLDVPFVWGPVGGTQNYPWRFLRKGGLKEALAEGVRSILNNAQFRYQPRVRKASRKAVVVIAANSNGKHQFQKIHGIETVLQLDVGTTKIKIRPNFEKPIDGRPLRILWNGVFESRKALHLLIKALSQFYISRGYELRILGKGPMERHWKNLARRSGIENNCQWMGWLPHHLAMAQYDWADVLVFTSLRDTCGTVVPEALSQGVPVICLDHQGAGDVVTRNCGIKIPVTTPERAIAGFRDALKSLAEDTTKLQALSRGAIKRATDYLWSIKGRETARLYNNILSGKFF